VATRRCKNFEDMCNRLDTIPACDRQTDRHLATAIGSDFTQLSYGVRVSPTTCFLLRDAML